MKNANRLYLIEIKQAKGYKMKQIKLYGKLDLNEIITVDDSLSQVELEELIAYYIIDDRMKWGYEEIEENKKQTINAEC